MQAQEYLESLVEKLKSFIKLRNESWLETEKLFKNKGAKTENDTLEIIRNGEMTDEEMDKYFYLTVIKNDTDILSKKVADFIHFSKVLEIELNLDSVSEITGFTELLRDYKPYETTFILTPENQTKEANTELFKKNSELFKKTLRQKGVMDLIDEARN